MQIKLNGELYDVPEEYQKKLVEDLFGQIEGMYNTFDDSVKIMLQTVARGWLVKQEMSVLRTHGKEVARQLRPPHKADPAIFAAKLFLPQLNEVLKHAALSCETTGKAVTGFAISIENQSTRGRQMDTDGDIGLRKINGPQVP